MNYFPHTSFGYNNEKEEEHVWLYENKELLMHLKNKYNMVVSDQTKEMVGDVLAE